MPEFWHELNRYGDTGSFLNNWGIFVTVASKWIGIISRAFLFFIIICAKAWLGPAFLCSSLIYVIYLWSHGLSPEWLPVLQDILDWIFEGLPKNISTVYSLVVLSYISYFSISDSVSGQA
ncbi:MAG: hypothetical protein NTX45_22040 [Proteobacteria bacterium]|nr:hypothetical protein [Pseudomonadota bacterium]